MLILWPIKIHVFFIENLLYVLVVRNYWLPKWNITNNRIHTYKIWTQVFIVVKPQCGKTSTLNWTLIYINQQETYNYNRQECYCPQWASNATPAPVVSKTPTNNSYQLSNYTFFTTTRKWPKVPTNSLSWSFNTANPISSLAKQHLMFKNTSIWF